MDFSRSLADCSLAGLLLSVCYIDEAQRSRKCTQKHSGVIAPYPKAFWSDGTKPVSRMEIESSKTSKQGHYESARTGELPEGEHRTRCPLDLPRRCFYHCSRSCGRTTANDAKMPSAVSACQRSDGDTCKYTSLQVSHARKLAACHSGELELVLQNVVVFEHQGTIRTKKQPQACQTAPEMCRTKETVRIMSPWLP